MARSTKSSNRLALTALGAWPFKAGREALGRRVRRSRHPRMFKPSGSRFCDSPGPHVDLSATFTFFVVVEKVTRKHLSQYCSQKYENTKDFIVKAITEDCDVQFHWTLISHIIDEEEDAIIVLEGLASMWVTIRGFSLCLEEYKRSKKITVSKTKALRNTLKQND